MHIAPTLFAILLSLPAVQAAADIYGYIDEKGEGHFSTEKLDEHYQLLQRSGQVFDSSKIGSTAGGAFDDTNDADNPRLTQYLTQHPNLKKYEALVNQAAREFAVEPALLKAVMAAESGFNPNAVSPKGAIGLMQLMPATAQHYGLQADHRLSVQQKLTDPKTNIWLAAHYLSDLGKTFSGRFDLVVASYNAGEHAVQRYNNTVPPFAETRGYVEIVTRIYKIYKPSSDTNLVAFSGQYGTQASPTTAPTSIHMIIPAHPHPSNPLPEYQSETQ